MSSTNSANGCGFAEHDSDLMDSVISISADQNDRFYLAKDKPKKTISRFLLHPYADFLRDVMNGIFWRWKYPILDYNRSLGRITVGDYVMLLHCFKDHT
jgi:hypothetical protein